MKKLALCKKLALFAIGCALLSLFVPSALRLRTFLREQSAIGTLLKSGFVIRHVANGCREECAPQSGFALLRKAITFFVHDDGWLCSEHEVYSIQVFAPERARLPIPFGNDEISCLEQIRGLRVVYLDGISLSYAEIKRLSRIETIEVLGLRRTGLTDEAMTYLNSLPNLRELDLSYTRVGDVGVAKLLALPHLKELNLQKTAVTDAGVETLKGCPELSHLNVEGTGVTRHAADGLEAGSRVIVKLTSREIKIRSVGR